MLSEAITSRRKRFQSGVMLLEALIGILIFSMGILAMVAMQATTISMAADAQYRSEAAFLADEIISRIWVSVDRSDAAALQASLNTFRYNTSGSNCNFSGGAADAGNTVLANWVAAVTTAAGTRLPGATAAMQQVLVDTAANNLVTVTVCWRPPQDTQSRKHVVTANIS
ncbi:MAG: type IV pilus modification protein PilV [Burkholderiales bacterium]